MEINNKRFCKDAASFAEKMFKVYLEERNFSLFLTMLHKNISWFGTGEHEICKNYGDAVDLLEAEKTSWDGNFKILEQWYQSVYIDEEYCLVFGEIKIIEDGLNIFLLDMSSRFSVICKKDEESGEIKLYHIHFSVANEAQSSDEFVHKSIVKNYNVLLEEKLEERTKLLKEKSFELETLTNNIEAAIIRGSFDKNLTITYANDGFFRMIGYTKEQFLDEKNNSLGAIVHPDDFESMNTNITKQLETGIITVNVNRLIRRDGSYAWILAKGTVLNHSEGTAEFHGVMTDITEQQEQKEELKISEKRYEIAMAQSDVTMFEYNIITKQLILPGTVAKMYKVPTVIENGIDTFVKNSIIEPVSEAVYREMYRKIHEGEPFAKCLINSRDANDVVHEFELSLTNVYDNNGKPIRAIGVRKNVTQMRLLQKEKKFGESLALNKHFICEANITRGKIVRLNEQWANNFGINDSISLDELVENLCKREVEEPYIEEVIRQLSKENIILAFEKSQRLISFCYRKKADDEQYYWFEATVNIIKDEETGDIIIRYYTENINDQKEKERKAIEEKRFYETMSSKSIFSYEVNITKNLFTAGHEVWAILYQSNKTTSYSYMINEMAEKSIHPNDREQLLSIYNRENILQSFNNGETKLTYEYRFMDKDGEFIWVRCHMHVYEEPISKDICGYSYIENIDKQKKAEISLVYKSEHDMLTGIYNKSATEKYINDFLSTSNAKASKHAFVIIDIDHFKSINDNFGHAFGDAVLSQVSGRITETFRDDDIVGRIGGDEFVVMMKNIPSNKIASSKAEKLCLVVPEIYSQNGKNYQISVSIGIAIYPNHGKNYDELYRHSDSALYVSKRNGRDRFSMYNDNMEIVASEVNDIDANELLEVKTFDDNISEYVFRILYESQDKETSVNAVLSLIGKHYNVSRAYVFEDTDDGLYTNNTFEWCNHEVDPQRENLQNVSYDYLVEYRNNFDSEGVFYMPDIFKASEAVREILLPQNVRSMLQFSIVRDGKMVGFIGFDQCSYFRVPSKKEISDCRTISQILGVFITEMRSVDKNKAAYKMALSIVNGLDSYAYVCDSVTHEVFFINEKTNELVPTAKIGQKCYKAFWDRDSECEVCPMKSLVINGGTKCSMDIENNNLNIWVKATASWIDWLGGHKVCLVDSVDITNYRTNLPLKQ